MAMQERPQYIGAEVKALSNLIKRRIDDSPLFLDPKHPTGTQGMIVGYLCGRQGDDVFQRDIETVFNIRRSTATGILNLMEQKELLTREPVAYDERLKKLKLTPKAVALHEEIVNHLLEIEKLLASGLTNEEVENFFRTIKIMKANMS